jgi:hypothetical protein
VANVVLFGSPTSGIVQRRCLFYVAALKTTLAPTAIAAHSFRSKIGLSIAAL